MDHTDPRVLLTVLDDLEHSLRRVTLEIRDSIHGAEQSQRQLREHAELLMRRIEFLRTDVLRADRLANEKSEDFARASHRAKDAEISARAANKDAAANFQRSSRGVKKWKAEVSRAQLRLSDAQAWVRRARDRVSQAQSRVMHAEVRVSNAERDLSNAQSRLAWAQSALSSCQQPRYVRDSDGNTRTVYNNCSSEASQVSSAQHEVSQAHSQLLSARMELGAAHSELSSAQSELTSAERELSAAQADLAHCENCLNIAKSAMNFAQAAVSHAETGLATAAEAADAIAAAEIPLNLLLNQQQMMFQDLQVLDHTNETAQDAVSEAQENLRWANQHSQVAEETALLAGNELSLRMDKLIEFDRLIQLPPGPS